MSGTTTTGAGSDGSAADNTANQNATGGDPNTEAGNSETKKIAELEKQFNGQSAEMRKLQKAFKEQGTLLKSIADRLSPKDGDGDDDDDDDDEGDEGSQGDGAQQQKQQQASEGKKNPEVRKLYKKLDKTRKDSETAVKAANDQANAWKSRYERTELKRVLHEELGKYNVLPQARAHVVKLIESDLETSTDDDGAVEVSHPNFPTVGKYLEEFFAENPLFLANERKSGTGDGGGAERNQGNGSGGFKLPHGFEKWDQERQREFWAQNPELRKQFKNSGLGR